MLPDHSRAALEERLDTLDGKYAAENYSGFMLSAEGAQMLSRIQETLRSMRKTFASPEAREAYHEQVGINDDDLRVPGDTPKPRPLIADDDLRIPGASGPPRPLMADDGRRPRGDSMQDRPLTFNSSDDDRRMRGDSPPPQPLMAHQGPRRPQTPGAPLAQRAASPSPEDFVTIWDTAQPATPRQAAFDDDRPRRRRAPDPPPEPPLVWKNDRPKRSKTARRRARRLEGLPDVIRRQANKF